MRYDEYYASELEKYKKKISFLKKLPFFIILGVLAIGSIVGLMLSSGNVYDSEIENFEYGGQIENVPKSFLATSFYEFKYEDEWSEEAPTSPGEYTYRIRSVTLFGRKLYSKEYTYRIDKRKAVVYCDVNTTSYGKKPTASARLLGMDKLVDYSFIYESMIAAKTNISVDVNSVRIEDINGNDVTDCYNILTRTTEITFTSVPLVIKLDDAEKPYDGTSLNSCTYTVEYDEDYNDLLDGSTITFDTIGSQTYAGSSEIKVNEDTLVVKTASGDTLENVRVSFVPATLTVTPIEFTISTLDDEITYDGNTHTFNTYQIDKAIPDTFTVSGVECKNAKTYDYALTPIFANTAIANSYTVHTNYGKITVNKKDLTVTLNDIADIVYDGVIAYTNIGFTVDETLLYGSQLEVNGSLNSFTVGTARISATSYTLKNGTEDTKNNYNITFVDGNATIIPKAITITPTMEDTQYTGTVITKDGTITSNPDLVGSDMVLFTASTATENLGEQIISIDSYQIKNGDKDVTSCYTVTKATGTSNIIPRELELTVGTGTSEYGTKTSINYSFTKGSVLTQHETFIKYIIDGNEYDIDDITMYEVKAYEVDGILTIKDGSDNDASSYYNINIKKGSLTVGKRKITVTATNKQKEYDGIALAYTDSDWQLTGGEILATDTLTYTAPAITQTIVGSISTSLNLNNITIVNSTSDDVEDCYDVKFVNGNLTVQRRTLIVIADSAIKEFDFRTLTCITYTSYGELSNHKVEAVVAGELKKVGSAANSVSSVKVYEVDSHGEILSDVTNYYSIITYDGTLTYTERSEI